MLFRSFTQGEATVAATLANPEINFGQVDATWPEAGADFTPGTADDLPFPRHMEVTRLGVKSEL